jgi:hypothetical protein
VNDAFRSKMFAEQFKEFIECFHRETVPKRKLLF